MAQLVFTVADAKSLKSSRNIYCEVAVIDAAENIVGTPLRTKTVGGSASPVWNEDLAFSITPQCAGAAFRIYEKHSILSDKFLGIVKLKFNLDNLKKSAIKETFTVLSAKKNKKTSATLTAGVAFKDLAAPQKDEKPEADKPQKACKPQEEEKSEETAHQPLSKSKKWAAKDDQLKDKAFVVIQGDVEGDSPLNTSTADLRSSKTIKKKKEENAVEGLPKNVEGQIALIQQAVAATPDGCIKEIDAEDVSNLSIVVINRQSKKTANVSLIVPDNLEKGDYILWTEDGTFELGRTGSIMRALNKVIESFARKNKVEATPNFPVPVGVDESRKVLLSSGWASRLAKSAEISVDGDGDIEIGSDDAVVGSGEFDDMDGEAFLDDDDAPILADDDGDYDYDFESSGARQEKAEVQTFVNSFGMIHKEENVYFIEQANDLKIRFAVEPAKWLHELMGEIWRINMNQQIAVEFVLLAPEFHKSMSPPAVKLYQTPSIQEQRPQEFDFGLKWYLEKRLEVFLRKNWPPPTDYLLVDMHDLVVNKILNCTTNCMLCDDKLEFPMLKPSICDKQLCCFGYDQFGVGIDLAAEIHNNSEVVDLLISFTSSVARADLRRFTPFPKHIEVSWKDASGAHCSKIMEDSSKEPTQADAQKVSAVIELLPSVADMKKFETSLALKEGLDKLDRLCFPLLRWILTSNRAHVTKLKEHEMIPNLGTNVQFTLLSTPPAKERAFKKMEQDHRKGSQEGKFYAFHGSGFFNWHSILRTGLRNLSGTSLMSTGSAYGPGIYLGADSGTSMGYAGSTGGWSKSIFGASNQCMAVCEVINAGYNANPYYVVQNENHVVTRYVVIFNGSNPHKGCAAKALTVPGTKYAEVLSELNSK